MYIYIYLYTTHILATLYDSIWCIYFYDHLRQDATAAPYCCPTPPESPASCRTGPVKSTQYVEADGGFGGEHDMVNQNQGTL
jgi:hypothetical protein